MMPTAIGSDEVERDPTIIITPTKMLTRRARAAPDRIERLDATATSASRADLSMEKPGGAWA